MCSIYKTFQNLDDIRETESEGTLDGKLWEALQKGHRPKNMESDKTKLSSLFCDLWELLNLFVLRFLICKADWIMTVEVGAMKMHRDKGWTVNIVNVAVTIIHH